MRDFLGGKRRLLLFSGHDMRWEDGVNVFLEQKKKKRFPLWEVDY